MENKIFELVEATMETVIDPGDEWPTVRERTSRLHRHVRGCPLDMGPQRLHLHIRVVALEPADDLGRTEWFRRCRTHSSNRFQIVSVTY